MRDKIVLLDEMGNEVEFEVVMKFGLDDSDYAVLLPVDDLENEMFLRFEIDENGKPILFPLDEYDEEYEVVKETYEEFKRERLQ